MATIQLFRGTRRVLLGDEFVSGEFIEVDAERVGGVWEEYDARGVETSFYRASDGRFIVHQRRWSRWENEPEISEVFVFPTPADAEGRFWWELEQAGVIPCPTLTLDEVDGR
jgi:hypothetical protein